MSTEEFIPPRAKRLALEAKIVGWLFFVIGSFGCISPVSTLFHPEATVSVNGVPTHEFNTKLGVAAFVIMFPLIGSFFVFTRRRTLEKWIAASNRWPKDWLDQKIQRK